MLEIINICAVLEAKNLQEHKTSSILHHCLYLLQSTLGTGQFGLNDLQRVPSNSNNSVLYISVIGHFQAFVELASLHSLHSLGSVVDEAPVFAFVLPGTMLLLKVFTIEG